MVLNKTCDVVCLFMDTKHAPAVQKIAIPTKYEGFGQSVDYIQLSLILC